AGWYEPRSTFHLAVWTSADGRTWLRVPDARVFATGSNAGFNAAVAEGPAGIVAIGSYCTETSDGAIGHCRLIGWHSPDGRSWSRVNLPSVPVWAKSPDITR